MPAVLPAGVSASGGALVTGASERSEPQLENATQTGSGHEQGSGGGARAYRSLWNVKVYRTAGEVVLYQPSPGLDPDDVLAASDSALDRFMVEDVDVAWEEALSEEAERLRRAARCRSEAARRARTRVRRYCKANGLDRLLTLTFRCRRCGPGGSCSCSTPDRPNLSERAVVVEFLGAMVRALREAGGEDWQSFPYVWVIEEHKNGYLHAHVAFGRKVALRCRRCDPRDVGKGMHQRDVGGPCLACCWGQGFVNAKRMKSRKRSGSGQVATYVAKYVGKGVECAGKGQKSYDVARGYQPSCDEGEFIGTDDEAIHAVIADFFGGRTPAFVWSSATEPGWEGPPVRVLFFDG